VSLLSRLLGRDRPDPGDVVRAVTASLTTVPGVTATSDLDFLWLQYGSGSLSGRVDVTGLPAYDEALDALHRALVGVLGDTADRVVVYVSGRGPDGAAYDGTSLGLPARPLGSDLDARYA
jgi:hypothetical protein